MSGLLVREPRRQATLADRYELEDGRVFLTGVQALVRVLIDQHRADAAAGLRVGTLASGYPGSPLAGFDLELGRLGALAERHSIVSRRAVNEELGATAVWGTQLVRSLPGARVDGVVGVFYGKAPGVDRAGDAIRHGNLVGTDPHGGVLALCGDDPASKSSTIPSASEPLLAALRVPVLAPGSVQEALDLGRHAIACSRASGLWAALKVVTNVADATATVEVGPGRVVPVMPVLEWHGVPYVHRPSANLLPPESLELERSLVEVRLELAKRYARSNALNRVVIDSPNAQLGIVASGVTAHEVVRALGELGLGEHPPVRVLVPQMLFPLDEDAVRAFAIGLREVLVIEEKGPFLERLVREALYGGPATPTVVGERDDRGARLVPSYGALDEDTVVRAVGARLLAHHDLPSVREKLARLDAIESRPTVELGAARTPFFCSGCPHNTSLKADDDAVVGAGIGCHTMVVLSAQGRGNVAGLTQMGSEGAQWIGVAPFVDVPHFIQNLGDGTYHHSGSLAIRAAVAAGVNVTYKLLVNGYVSMTGGQQISGGMSVPAMTRSLAAEGVRRIVITTDEVARHRDESYPSIVGIRDRRDVLAVQRELAQVPGVTVMLHEQACAAEVRRARKRGRAVEPARRVLINERVCEGCGDCGAKSSCLSVEPLDTEFGRKTQINQTSCNKDYTCLEGDCPSFVTVLAGEQATPRSAAPAGPPSFELPAPSPCVDFSDVRVRLVGIGGTGVVTVSQVLGMAALLDGLHCSGLDQTGLSQKAGPVVSDLHFTAEPQEASVVPASGALDLLLGFDLLGAADEGVLRAAEAERTVAVVSEHISPTAQMVIDVEASSPDVEAAHHAVQASTRAADNVALDAQLMADRIFSDATTANVIVLGAAWQRGALPLSLESIEEALRLNGVNVGANLAAFAWGRAWVAEPDLVAEELTDAAWLEEEVSAKAAALSASIAPARSELRRLVEIRVDDLLGWGGEATARSYVDEVARVAAIEGERVPGSTAIAEAFAHGMHKLTAYKDEYEVARLHLDWIASLPAGSRPVFHLHPPLLRALGMKRKLRLGRWFVPLLRLLRAARRLRGTPLDPFARTHVRRVERALPGEYRAFVDVALARLSPETLASAIEVAELPELVRGYEEIKLAGVERFRARGTELTGV
jgi:indolepyruvate ferredoxin oxidoreductase